MCFYIDLDVPLPYRLEKEKGIETNLHNISTPSLTQEEPMSCCSTVGQCILC
jgi:hypothetical protein